ncbi:MAG: hypothetical protein ACYC5G_04510, partial [Candidatus Doudnabacteria bacterium]
SPSYQLHVVSAGLVGIKSQLSGTGDQIYFAGAGASGNNLVEIYRPSATNDAYIKSPLGNIVLNPTSGNVGIGAVSPTAKLNILIPDTSTTPLLVESNDGADILRLQQYATTDRAQLQVGAYNGISTPNYSFIADTNTGIAGGFVADTLQFVTNGSEQVRISSTGSVGIGTTTPTTFKLEVAGNIGPEADNTRDLGSAARRFANLYATNVNSTSLTSSGLTPTRVVFAGTAGLLVDDADLTFITDTLTSTKVVAPTSVSTPSLISTGALTVTPAAGSNLNINLSTTGDLAVNTNQLYVDTSTGNVGVGTATPVRKLDVLGTIRASESGSGKIDIGIASNVGTIRAGGTTADTLDVGGASYLTLSTYVAGWQERMRIDTSGNVGIGTTSPTANLQVAQGTSGAGRVSTTATLTTVTGVGTQFLNTFKVGDTITVNAETRTISA